MGAGDRTTRALAELESGETGVSLSHTDFEEVTWRCTPPRLLLCWLSQVVLRGAPNGFTPRPHSAFDQPLGESCAQCIFVCVHVFLCNPHSSEVNVSIVSHQPSSQPQCLGPSGFVPSCPFLLCFQNGGEFWVTVFGESDA